MRWQRLEWAIASCVAGWAVARLTAADRVGPPGPVAGPLVSFTPPATGGAGLTALMLRGKGPSATAALAAGALAAVVAPRVVPRRQPAARGAVLKVLTVNL